MRKFFALIALLVACLFVAQSAMAAAAAYSDCCMEGCKGMAQCVSASCQVCAAPAAVATPPAGLPVIALPLPAVGGLEVPPPSPAAEIWSPPD